MEKITTLITDDHTLIRESLTSIIDSDSRFTVVGAVGSGEEAVELARQIHPRVILLDIGLPRMNGIETTRLLRQYSPDSKILGLSLHTESAYIRQMMKNGAMGYITKNSSREEMINAIIEICHNRKYICDEIRNVLYGSTPGELQLRNESALLSKTEMDIIGFIKKGLTNKEIARILEMAVKTVEAHLHFIFKKLNLRNVAALVNHMNHSHLVEEYE